MSFSTSKIALGTLGLILLHAGWMAIDRVDPAASFDLSPLSSTPVRELSSLFDDSRGSWEWIRGRGERLLGPPRALTAPLLSLFTPGKDIAWYLHSLLSLLCSILVWGIVGCAIARITVFQASKQQGSRIGFARSLRFSMRQWKTLVFAPLGLLLVMGMCAFLCAAVGLLFRIPGGAGAILGSALLIIPLISGLVMSILLVYFLLGWPLLHAAAASQGEDLYNATSRSLAYVNYRFGRVVVWIGMAWLIGIPALGFIDIMGSAAWILAMWGLSLSAPPGSLPVPSIEAVADLTVPARLFGGWKNLVAIVVEGWIPAYFWTSTSLLYLELRDDLDGTPPSTIIPGEDTARAAAEATRGGQPSDDNRS